jgi:uncharacterized protein with von Willebrand factor type A (vWA) domain
MDNPETQVILGTRNIKTQQRKLKRLATRTPPK